ncbi:hypothetical protein MVEN_01227300 [Mycena venus]|uniref:Yeast cell wall synthesis Kre9/Knh1-like N-terminal domain-containing protein n=1 Tax=Mycena venus TaxID=2733690 RepID=A0A8H7CYA0_9AGAR|nr:hypothetical protein MVEN_01227300 [Mycena venus]
MAPFNVGDDDEEMYFGRQILPVANLPADYEGIPEDGMQYLFTVRRDAKQLPHVTRVPNPPEWRTLFETRYRNFRKNLAQPTIHVSQPARSNNPKLLPDLKERDCCGAGLRGFAEDDVKMEDAPSAGSSRDAEAPETRPMNDDIGVQPQLPTPSGTPAPTEQSSAEPVYTPREPTPSLLKLIDQRMALHLLMYFTYWTNLHMQPEKRCRVTQTHARWIFVLLSRVDDYISADDTHLLRNLARAYLALLKDSIHSGTEGVSAEDINPGCCWLIISTVSPIMFSLAIVAAFVASVSAITITSPNPSQGWTNDGGQLIKWESVSTDPKNFTIILVNDDTTTTPVPQQLAALVNTADGQTTVNPPSEGWPAPGTKYRVKFVQDAEHLNTQLVESDEFAIKAAPVPSGSSTTPVQTLPPSTPTNTPANTDTGASASDSGAAPDATGTGAALPSMSVHTGLIGALVLLSAVLAQL